MLISKNINPLRNKSSLLVNSMEKPDLDSMWETFIKIPVENNQLGYSKLFSVIRTKIQPLISSLTEKKIINWYSFLIHDRHSGVPTTEDDNCPYFHVRISIQENVDSSTLLTLLPNFCTLTRKIEQTQKSISGINMSIITNEDISEAWRIIGEQCEWYLHLLAIHKNDVDIPPQQIMQFLHFFANMTQIRVG